MDAIGPAFEAVKCLSVPVARRIGYAKKLKKNFIKLEKLAKDLHDKRDDLKVNAARPGKAPTTQLLTWFEKVKEIEDRINAITEVYKQEKKCLGGLCFDICSRLKIGKQTVELMEDISVVKESIKSDSEAIVDAPLSVVERVSAPTIEGGNSADRTVEKIMGCIKIESVRTIGVWGMGGVGKTTVMKKLNNLPEIAQMFDIVIWVTVSRDWNLRKVQDEVADRLKLTLSNDMSNDRVSRKIYQRLENTKYLLLLDDVWDKVNLEDVGLPTSANGCKIVLTTRYQSVCNKMETDAEIKVEVLSAEEAWNLFCGKVGSVVASPEIEKVARDVVKECGGLPLAVIVVGGALRKEEDVHVWKDALKKLRSPSTSIQGMEEEVFQPLKFSYDKLKCNTCQKCRQADRVLNCDRQMCFLYGALFPEDWKINVQMLIEYWRAAGFLEGAESLVEATDRGHAIIKDLVDASLFEKGKNERGVYVKMHDVIRDLALSITSVEEEGDNKFLVRARVESRDPPGAKEWRECNAVSFMGNRKIEQLPEQVHCPRLITLLLQRCKLYAIPESFFESMAALRVLDLSGTNIKSLPPSICNLVSLRGLYLNGCNNSVMRQILNSVCGLLYLNECIELVELPPQIGALKELEVLHIEYCPLPHLPVEVGELSHLKSLHVDLFQLNGDNMLVPQGIVSGLSLLEDLSIYVSNNTDYLKVWDRNMEHVAKEIGKLKRLRILKIPFTRVEHLESFVHTSEPWRNDTLSSFKHNLILDLNFYYSYRIEKDCSFHFLHGVDVPNVVREVLRRTLHFVLLSHRSIRKLEELKVENNMTGLISLHCQNCPEMESLIEGTCPLPALQKLTLDNMPNLRNIWGEGQHLPVNLTELFLENCHSLAKVLFSHSIIQQLPNLERITVIYCKEIQEVISGDDNIEYNDALPKLRYLRLIDLPNLTSISKKTLAWPSIEEIEIDHCHNLKRLPFGIHNTSTLNAINCNNIAWWESLQWKDDEIKTQLQTKLKPIHPRWSMY